MAEGNQGGNAPQQQQQKSGSDLDNLDVGRIVHYVLGGGSDRRGSHRAAFVGLVHADEPGADPQTPRDQVNAVVIVGTERDFPAQGSRETFQSTYLVKGVRYDPTGETPGTWHWPEKSPEGKAAASRRAR